MDIRMAVIDLDGTLLDDELRLRDTTRHTLQRLVRAGVRVVLCSARAPESMAPIAAEFGGMDPLVAHNGALVAKPELDVLRFLPLGRPDLEVAVQECRRRGLHFDVNGLRWVYVEGLPDWMIPIYQRYWIEPVEAGDVLKVPGLVPLRVLVVGAQEEVLRLAPELESRLPQLAVTRSGSEFIDVRRKEASKAEAAAWLARRWGIDRSQVFGAGNYYNDIPLLRWAGCSVAVANAPEEVRRNADYVVPDNNSEGVSEALERVVALPGERRGRAGS